MNRLFVALYRAAVRMAPLGLGRRWRDRMVMDFEARVVEASRLKGRSPLLVTLRALVDLTAESGRRTIGTTAAAQGRSGRSQRPRMNPMDVVWQDVRYAIRGIGRTPGVTAVVVLTLALAIGANTTLFSVFNGVLLRPLPYENPDNLYAFVNHYQDGSRGPSSSYPDFVDLRRDLGSLAHVVAYNAYGPTMTAEGAEPRRLAGQAVSKGYFEALGLTPTLGRFFTDEDITERTLDVVVIGHGLWELGFASDPDIIGRTIELNGRPRTVVGVGPSRFPRSLPALGSANVWVPLEYETADPEGEPGRASHNLGTIVRVAEGTDIAVAEAELDAYMAGLEETYPETNLGKSADLESIHTSAVGDAAQALWILMGGVVVVLLIAVSNVTNILLGRAADREQEFALRSALGADRGRIYGQLVVESLVLAGAGGILGTVLAYVGTARFVEWAGGSIPLSSAVSVDPVVLVSTGLVVGGVGLAMGIVPAWISGRGDLHGALREGTRGTSSGGRLRLRNALVVAQFGLSLTLLVGAGLLLRSLSALDRVDTGVDTSVLSFGLQLPMARYQEWSDHDVFRAELEERLLGIPGIVSVGSTNGTPLGRVAICGSLHAEEDPDRLEGGDTCAQVRSVSPNYFDVMDIPLLRGRALTEMDNADSDDVIVVNQATADLLFPGQEALGKRIMTGFRGTYHEIVGVVGNVTQFRVDEEPQYQTYISNRQWRQSGGYLVVKHQADPATLIGQIREAVWAVDDMIPLYNVNTLEELRRDSMAEERFRTVLIAAMSGLALLLAVVGIYGVISYSVSQRQREIAIRVSMGANAADVRRMVMSQAARLVLLGLGVGTLGGYFFGRALEGLLFDVRANDPVTLVAVGAVLVASAFLATLIPARRATGVDPMMVMREG